MIRHVAIVGAGFSGTLLALNLLRHDGPRATLIERAEVAGRGVAYGTAQPDHVLNVRAANMSAFPDQPDHFVRWLGARGAPDAGASFVARATYGRYLREMLEGARALAPDRLRIVTGAATDIADTGRDGGCAVTLADGGTIAADAAVLAVGNLPPHVPPGLEAVAASPRYFGNPWDPAAVRDLDDGDTVVLVGTGLTMVDVALMLEARGFAGRMVALSRRGLVPHRHAPARPNPSPRAERPRASLSLLVRTVRTRGAAIGWRGAVDELRPFTQALWAGADGEERRRFLRHLRPWWDIHRHRLAPSVADRIAALIESGRLSVVAGRTCDAADTPDGIAIAWRPRGEAATETLVARRVICCTGPQGDLGRTDDALLARLVAAGRIRPDPERLGIEVDASGHAIAADGAAADRLFAIGPMTRGAFWEIVAVPDIRRQVWDLARHLSNAHWVGGEGL